MREQGLGSRDFSPFINNGESRGKKAENQMQTGIIEGSDGSVSLQFLGSLKRVIWGYIGRSQFRV